MKVIGIDLGGVCLTDCWSEETIAALSDEFGFSQEELRHVTECFLTDLSVGNMTAEEFIGEFADNTEEVEAFILSRNRVLFPDVLDILKGLKGKYVLALMNNEGRDWNEYRLDHFNLRELFDVLLSSCYLGEAKPSQEYFGRVVRELGVPAHEIFFFDDREKNVAGARAAGIVSRRFISPDRLRDDLTEVLGENL